MKERAMNFIYRNESQTLLSCDRSSVRQSAAINERRIYGCIGSTALTGANQPRRGRMRGKRYQSKHIFHVRLPAIFHGSFAAKSIYHRARETDPSLLQRRLVSPPFPLYWPSFSFGIVRITPLTPSWCSFRDFDAFDSD